MTAWRNAWGLSLTFHLAVGLLATPILGRTIPPVSDPLQVRLGPISPASAPAPTPTLMDSHLPSRPAVVGSVSKRLPDTVRTIESAPAGVVPDSGNEVGPSVAVVAERSPAVVPDAAARSVNTALAMVDPPVDVSIVCPERPAPVYPAAARRRGEEGKVILAIRLDQKGATSVSVASSSGSRWLDEAAIQAVKSWRCNPAMQGGVTVQATALQTFSFVLQGGV